MHSSLQWTRCIHKCRSRLAFQNVGSSNSVSSDQHKHNSRPEDETVPANVKQFTGSVCVDKDGNRRAVGSTWSTDDACTRHTCTETGHVVSVSVSCALPVPPRKGCFQYTPEGECCPRWNCRWLFLITLLP